MKNNLNITKLPKGNFDLIIFAEGSTDKEIIKSILKAANFGSKGISVEIMGSKQKVKQMVYSLPPDVNQKVAALVDADIGNIPDSRAYANEQLGNPHFPVFCAVPEIEAWLFADDKLALQLARNDRAKNKINRLSVPESISYPKQVAKDVFGKLLSYTDFENMDIERAMARSASLRDFLIGISEILHTSLPQVKTVSTHSLSRDIFASLIKEIIPSNSVVWKTSDGNLFTAQELSKEIEEGSDLGKQYISDVLRIARDMLSRKAKRG